MKVYRYVRMITVDISRNHSNISVNFHPQDHSESCQHKLFVNITVFEKGLGDYIYL